MGIDALVVQKMAGQRPFAVAEDDAAAASTTHAVSADGGGYTSPTLTWTQGGHPVFTSFPGSVSPGGTSVQTVTATASGTVSASADWNPSSTTNTWSGSLPGSSGVDHFITVSARGRSRPPSPGPMAD